MAVDKLLEELEAEKKAKAKKIAKELKDLMNVEPQEWLNDVRAARRKSLFSLQAVHKLFGSALALKKLRSKL